jgi:hypothetical protein
VLEQYKRTTNIGVGIGMAVGLAGAFLSRSESIAILVIANVCALAGVAIFVWGCSQYAKGKGHSPWWGFLGLLSIFGLVALVFFPDKR